MALTGYLGSNLIGSFVWYGWGLGLMGVWSGAAMNLFAFAVFAGLAVFSALWLAVFRFGPVEWVWRCISYGRLQPTRPRTSARRSACQAARADTTASTTWAR